MRFPIQTVAVHTIYTPERISRCFWAENNSVTFRAVVSQPPAMKLPPPDLHQHSSIVGPIPPHAIQARETLRQNPNAVPEFADQFQSLSSAERHSQKLGSRIR
jgi:hypothetical protein